MKVAQVPFEFVMSNISAAGLGAIQMPFSISNS